MSGRFSMALNPPSRQGNLMNPFVVNTDDHYKGGCASEMVEKCQTCHQSPVGMSVRPENQAQIFAPDSPSMTLNFVFPNIFAIII